MWNRLATMQSIKIINEELEEVRKNILNMQDRLSIMKQNLEDLQEYEYMLVDELGKHQAELNY